MLQIPSVGATVTTEDYEEYNDSGHPGYAEESNNDAGEQSDATGKPTTTSESSQTLPGKPTMTMESSSALIASTRLSWCSSRSRASKC